MSVAAEERARYLRRVGCTNAITALSAAGLALLQARGPGTNELVTALRDDLTRMIADVEAVQKVI